MTMLIVQRLLLAALTLLLVSMLIFVGTEILPGDAAEAVLGQSATPETVEAIRQSLGLHDPAFHRYLRWLMHFMSGDLGRSLTSGNPIAPEFWHRVHNTLVLAGVSAAVAVPLAILLGLLSAVWQGRWFDWIINIISIAAISIPEFFVAYGLIVVFSVALGWLPSLSEVPQGADLNERLWNIVLPSATIILAVLGYIMQMTRTAILDVMSKPYIQMAVLKGVPPWRIFLQHALPNAFAPVVQVVSFNLTYMIAGIVVVEVVFVYPGLGQYLVDAVATRDMPAVQACGMLFAAAFILCNSLADISAILMNPRLRYPR